MDIFDLALSMTPRVGGRTATHLIETFFSAENIFSVSYDELRHSAKLNDAVAMSIVRRDALRAAEAELAYCKKHAITPIAATDECYPSLLRETHDPPHVIYLEGDPSILTRNLISIVGTRNISSYGDRVTSLLVEQMAEKIRNIVIVSGLAFGVDGAAHRAAIKCDIPTIAVLPNSLPGVTPAAHSQLARAIVDSGGALITELRSTSHAAGKAYIARNRIIAGMSAATIVVESSIRGGALATARIADSEGRVVGAVPGRIVDGTSMGCNKLIADGTAIVVSSADDLIRKLKWEDRVKEQRGSGDTAKSDEPKDPLSDLYNENQRTVLQQFQGSDPLTFVELEMATGFSVTQLGVVLMELELLGALKAIPGARYESLL